MSKPPASIGHARADTHRPCATRIEDGEGAGHRPVRVELGHGIVRAVL